MSNRLTFSLASLIVLIAFGLVFGTTSVMAHPAEGVEPTQVPDDPTTHTHVGMTPVDAIVDDPATDAVTEATPPHNSHPTVMISLKAGDNVSADGTTVRIVDAGDPTSTTEVGDEQTFTLVIEFNQVVATDATTAATPTAAQLEAGDLTSDIQNMATIPTVVVASADIGIGTPTVVGTDYSKYEVLVTIDEATGIPSGTADADDEELTFRVILDANSVFSLQTTGAASKPGETPTTYGGGGNAESMVYEFTLASALADSRPTLEVTTDTPTDAVTTGSFDIMYTTADADMDTVMVAATHTVVPSSAMAHYTLDTSVDGTVTVNQAMPDATTPMIPAASVTVTLTPSDATGPGMAQTFTIFFNAAMYTAPNMRPTATISTSAPADAVTTGSFAIMYTTADVDDDDVTVAVTHSVSPASAMAHYTVADSTPGGTVTVTQAAPTATTMTIPAATVTVTITPSDTAAGAPVMFTVSFAARTYVDPSAGMLESGEYLVVVRDSAMVTSGYFGANGPSMDDVHVWADMPDLQKLFDVGGTLQLKVTGAAKRDVVFSEVMWAIDERLIGDPMFDDNQWIEIHNRTSGTSAKNFNISDITLTAKERRPALAEETDRLSNIVSGGGEWIFEKGQNGNSGTTANGVTVGQVEFVSMYRTRYDREGWLSRDWAKSSELYKSNHRGTPGAKERPGAQIVGTTSFNVGPVIFNEVSNRKEGKYEWFELRNKSDSEQNLKNREIRIVKEVGTDASLFQFGDQDVKIPAGGVLLCVFTDPRGDDNHPIATGWNIDLGASAQINGVGAHSPRYLVIADSSNGKRKLNEDAFDVDGEGFPDEFVLILRSRRHNDDVGKDTNIWDIAGYDTSLKVAAEEAGFTNLWPLKGGVRNAELGNNKWDEGTVHRRQKDNVWGTSSTNYGRNSGNHHDDTAWRNVGWTGIGYRRNAAAGNENGGTPGYANNALQSNETQAGADPVIISEIMYATGSRANIPQWIELRNTSKTVGVNLDGWRVTIINHDQDVGGVTFAGDLNKNYGISGRIPPGQTFLLVAYPGRDDTNLPDERVYSLPDRKRGDLILSQYGFEITLLTKGKDNKDANRKLADKVGNLATVADGRVRRNPQSYEDPAWALPMGTNDDGDRISIVRASIKGDPINGQLPGAWNRFDMSAQFTATLDATSYGHGTDLSSPGHTVGGVLPVSLSKFRPERMKDTGAVVIRWITESELNNAGFNILRGEALDGEFTKLNTKLIAGQGTTSERTTYTYTDTSAKPNVIYYYQIQDVSLEGQVSTLRTTHLRGNVTAAGKLTTTWGELKALQ